MRPGAGHDHALSSFNLSQLDDRHLDLEIIAVNLFVYLDHQGYCDERRDLSQSRNKHRWAPQKKPPSANHYAIWFSLGELVMVSVDVTQRDFEQLVNPYRTDGPIKEGSLAEVRVASKTMPTTDDAACVMMEIYNVKAGTTIREILGLIHTKGLHHYQFKPTFKQHSGCRHWILVFSQELERARIVGRGFADDVKSFLMVNYVRATERVKGKVKKGDTWGQSTSSTCAEIVAGKFLNSISATASESRETSMFWRTVL